MSNLGLKVINLRVVPSSLLNTLDIEMLSGYVNVSQERKPNEVR